MSERFYACMRCGREIQFPNVLLLSQRVMVFECECTPGDIRRVQDLQYEAQPFARLLRSFPQIILPYSAADTPRIPQPFLDKTMGELSHAWWWIRNVHDFIDVCETFDRVSRGKHGS